MVYCSEHASLAVLEILVHLKAPTLLPHYVLSSVEVPKSAVRVVRVEDLPDGWAESPSPPALRDMGDDWIKSGSSLALRVPSAVIPIEFNLLLNPAHPDFAGLTVTGPAPFPLDPRLLR